MVLSVTVVLLDFSARRFSMPHRRNMSFPLSRTVGISICNAGQVLSYLGGGKIGTAFFYADGFTRGTPRIVQHVVSRKRRITTRKYSR